jgi:hypothetical protein
MLTWEVYRQGIYCGELYNFLAVPTLELEEYDSYEKALGIHLMRAGLLPYESELAEPNPKEVVNLPNNWIFA